MSDLEILISFVAAILAATIRSLTKSHKKRPRKKGSH